MRSVSILGAGWLGTPLAALLKEEGFRVHVTKRQTEDVALLCTKGYVAAAYALGDDIPSAVDHSDIAIINIPPKRKTVDPGEFTQKMTQLCDHLFHAGTKQLLFISTTSVFGDQTGVIHEATPPKPTTESGNAHTAIEAHLMAHYSQQTSILRLSGLIGGERHPAKSLAGKTGMKLPHHPVNLVHRNDVIQTIQAIIRKNAWGQTFLLSATDHPTKQDYYVWAAMQLGLTPPAFEAAEQPQSPKIIDCQSTLNQLEIQLAFPSPYDMLPLV